MLWSRGLWQREDALRFRRLARGLALVNSIRLLEKFQRGVRHKCANYMAKGECVGCYKFNKEKKKRCCIHLLIPHYKLYRHTVIP